MNLALALVLLAQELPARPGDDLNAAVARASKGMTIVLAAGRYPSGQLTLGPSTAGVTIRSKPGERAVIDFEGKGGFYLKADGVVLQDLDILNAQNFAVDIDGSDCRLEGCRILGSGGDVVKLSPGNWQQKKYNKGALILRCEIGTNKAFEGIDCVGQDDVRVIDCYIHDTPGWGLYLKGGAARGLVEGCVFERCGTLENNPAGGACLGEHTGPDEVMTNKHGKPWESVDGVVRNCMFLDIPGPAMAAWCARNATFANNTCVNTAVKDRASFVVLANHGLPSTDVTFINNIVSGSMAGNRPLVWIYDKGAEGKLVFEHNLYFGGNARFWNSVAGGPVGFDDWKTKSGLDRTSRYADPKLDDELHLTAGSPAIDLGKTLEGFLTDFDGAKRRAPWDIGADDFQAGPARPLRAAAKR